MVSLSIRGKLMIAAMLPAVATAVAVFMALARTSWSNGAVFAVMSALLLIFAISEYIFITIKVAKPIDMLNRQHASR